MLVILPPSETKRDGGTGRSSYLEDLRFPALTPYRQSLIEQLADLAGDPEASMKALKISARQIGEIERNRGLHEAPVMPAIDRYTGVLFDALGAPTLTADERAFAHAHVAVHSALFGPVGALDPIPAYRLSHSSRLPEGGLRQQWGRGIRHELAQVPGLVLDLRSEGYSELGPLELSPERLYVRVMARGANGETRALNHFNKKTKGAFTRALVQSGLRFESVAGLRDWAASVGFELGEPTPAHEIALIAPSPEMARAVS
ncbi:YaaA family protein [Okibacterium fritillariae]|uniref:Peroxide stress protein YaaA n=1 Tax=Okibacterium fritillariae TaxID=123320 RepID=A0A1T5KJU3_9MICO|nr:peroxide stress protein YaaA [Okibacterium fritillariae]SKC64006.1 hypothetical protein SAMN06309945_2331 [Okibacterium fritillariae]